MIMIILIITMNIIREHVEPRAHCDAGPLPHEPREEGPQIIVIIMIMIVIIIIMIVIITIIVIIMIIMIVIIILIIII